MRGSAGRAARDLFDVAQAKEWAAGHVRREVDAAGRRVVDAALRMPALPFSPGRGELWAVATVRDEHDVIGDCVAHLLEQGVDRVLVSDHRSQDGTREYLLALAERDRRVSVALDETHGHFQKEKITRLSRAAWRAGAAWVVPFDADEFWFADRGSLGEALRAAHASVLFAETHYAVPDGAVPDDAAPAAAEPGAGTAPRRLRVDAAAEGVPKVAFRAHPLVRVGPGNHGVDRVGPQEGGLRIAHAAYRSRAQLASKFRIGAASLDEAGAAEWEGWHWRAGAALDEDGLDRLWASIREGVPTPQIDWNPSGAWRGVEVPSASSWERVVA